MSAPRLRQTASARQAGTQHDDAVDVERYELDAPARYRFELQRRDFIRVFAAMGGGLAVLAASAKASAPKATAQESGRAGAKGVSADVSAWLHIGEDGRVTACTGKTEIGQNIRTSLAQAVADELHVALDAVTMVMADTALVPWDAGTFGSLSTPRMAPVLGRAAATARQMLIDRAAQRWQVERRNADRARRARHRRLSLARVRRTGSRRETDRRRARRPSPDPTRRVARAWHRPAEGARPRLRDRAAPVHAGPAPPGTQVWMCRASAGLRRDAGVGRRCEGAGDAGRHRRARCGLRGCGGRHRARGASCRGRDWHHVAHRARPAVLGHAVRAPQAGTPARRRWASDAWRGGRRPRRREGGNAPHVQPRVTASRTSRTCRSSRARRSPNGATAP